MKHGDKATDGHRFGDITAMPFDVPLPPVWLLHLSAFSTRQVAAAFAPSMRYPERRAILVVAVTVGETTEHAWELARMRTSSWSVRRWDGWRGI